MPVTPEMVSWAAEAFTVNTDRYAKARRYYAGEHELTYTSAKFQQAFGAAFKAFAYNRCRPVVDAQANKLKVTGFTVRGIDLANLAFLEADQLAGTRDYSSQAMTLWKLGEMDKREGELYVEAGITGDAYGVVYYDDPPPVGTGLPRIYPNRADVMRVLYDDGGRIVLAAKSWMITSGPDLGKRRLTFYTPTEIIKLITKQKAEQEMPKELGQYDAVTEVNALGQRVANPIVHGLGQVPVVHYANNAPMLGDYGISELQDVIPLQDALNKSVADMLVAMEYQAFQQRWAIGIDTPDVDPETGKYRLPFRQGPGEVWWTTDKDAKFGSFDMAELQGFIAAQDQFDLDIARVSHTPVHWLLMSGDFPSGESQKVASEPFTDKLKDRQNTFGSSHARAMGLKFRLLGVQEPLVITPDWEAAEPRSAREQAEIGKMMADAGVPLSIAARVMGLEEEELAEIQALDDDAATSREQALAQLAGQSMAQGLDQQRQTEQAVA